MYICICKAVRRSDIAQAVSEGATTFSELQETLSVSTGCGTCEPEAMRCFEIVYRQCAAPARAPDFEGAAATLGEPRPGEDALQSSSAPMFSA